MITSSLGPGGGRPITVHARAWPVGGQGRLHTGAVDVGLAAAGASQGAVAVGADVQVVGVVFVGDRSADGAFPAVGGLATLGAQHGCWCLHPSVLPRPSVSLGGTSTSMLGDDPPQ